ncbi:MAG TPA: hypothetical protein VFG95_01670, partial [Nitrospiria bacterium]|nr:hypothetical protein [Nitrospiria bacterium]
MTGYFWASLRVRLLFFVLLIIVPLIFYTVVEELKLVDIEVEEHTLTSVRRNSAEVANLAGKTRQILVDLSKSPEIHNADRDKCRLLLSTLLKQHPEYNNFGAAAPDGTVFCSGASTQGRTNVGKREFFKRTVETHEFAVGTFGRGGLSGKPVISFGYPILERKGKLQGAVYAKLDLSWLDHFIAKMATTEGTSL